MAHHRRWGLVEPLDLEAWLVPDRQADRSERAGHALGSQPVLGRFDELLCGFAVERIEEAPLADALPHRLLDELVQQTMGQGIGQWGFFDALDGEAAEELIKTAEDWLRAQGMTSSLGPISLSIWDEPGLEIEGFDEPPTAMMGHHRPEYRTWIESAGYEKAKDLLTYELDITHWEDPKIDRLIAMGERNPHIRIRMVDKSKFDDEARLILNILNDAWSN